MQAWFYEPKISLKNPPKNEKKKETNKFLKKIPNLADHFKNSIDQPYLNQFVF